MRQQAAATAAACTGEQSEFTGDGSDMMPAIGTPVAANTSLGASLTFTLPMSLPRLGDIGRATIYCATLARRAIRLGTQHCNNYSDSVFQHCGDAIRIKRGFVRRGELCSVIEIPSNLAFSLLIERSVRSMAAWEVASSCRRAIFTSICPITQIKFYFYESTSTPEPCGLLQYDIIDEIKLSI